MKKTGLIIGVIAIILIISVTIFILIPNKKNTQTGTNENKVTQNGRYNCEFLYNGEKLDNENTIKEYMTRISSLTGLSNEEMSVSNFKENFEENLNFYIEVSDNKIDLYTNIDNINYQYLTYDKKTKAIKFNTDTNSDEAKDTVEQIMNNIISISEKNGIITIKEFGAVFIYPTIYNNNIQQGVQVENIKYDIYTDLGDLVCKREKTEVQPKETDELSLYQSTIEKISNTWNIGIENTLYYSLYDINKDGIKELILKIEPYEGIVKVYTLENDKPKELIDSCGARCNVKINDNATIELSGSSNACSGIYEIYANINSDESKVTNWDDFGVKSSVSYTCQNEDGLHTDTVYYEINIDGKTIHTTMPANETYDKGFIEYLDLKVDTGNNLNDKFKWIKYK